MKVLLQQIYIFFNILHYFHNLNVAAAAPHASVDGIKCKSFDNGIVEADTCRIRSVNRDVRELTIKMKLLRVPVDNITVLVQLMKKSNGYNPYHSRFYLDCCKFLKHEYNPLAKFLWTFVRPYTNVNHTCPYNHDVIVDGLRIDQSLVPASLIPSGDYAFFTTWRMNNIKLLTMDLYFKFDD